MDNNQRTVLLLQAPAKVNLGLEVLRRRPDGFHDVNTIYAAIDLCDEIELQVRDDGQFVCNVEGNSRLMEEDPQDNLCVRALRTVRALFPEEADVPGIEVLLRKRIPIGAGLGGGSSDAALTMLGALQLWGKTVESAVLQQKAAELGSDIPFFVNGGVALAGSRGEHMKSLNVELPWTALLVNPGLHIATPWAYGAINRQGERAATDLEAVLKAGIVNPYALQELMANDFEAPVFAHYPQLKGIKERLYNAGAFFALMSGSGSTLFGLFQTREQALEAQRRFPEYWTGTAAFQTGTSSSV